MSNIKILKEVRKGIARYESLLDTERSITISGTDLLLAYNFIFILVIKEQFKNVYLREL